MKRLTLCALLFAASAGAQTDHETRLRRLEALERINVCGNDVCESDFEDSSTCPVDCPPVPPPPPPPDSPDGGLASATWTALPGSEMRSIYDPAIDDQWPKAPSSFAMIQEAWSGAACAGNELILWGGGHADSAHNGVFAVDVLSGKWRRVTLPAAAVPAEGTSQTNPDGSPVSRHTYGALASDGANLYAVGGALWPSGKGGDLPRSWRLELASGGWSQFADSPRSTSTGSLAYADRKLYHLSRLGAAVYELAAGTWTPGAGAATVSTGMVYAPDSDRLYVVGDGKGWYVDRASFGVSSVQLPANPALLEKSPGLTYYPPEKRLLIWHGGATIATYREGADSWEDVTLVGDPGPALVRGTYGRFSYCGGRVVLVNGVDRPLYYLDIEDPAPEPDPDPLPPNTARNPYFAEPPGDSIILRDCGSLPDAWETIDVRTSAEALAVEQWAKGRTGRVRIHARAEPYPTIRTKGGKCIMLDGVGGRPLVASVNATAAFKLGGVIRPGGLIVSNLEVSPGKAGVLTVADCLGVPNDQTFLVVRDSDVTQCGHHSFITSPASRHLYVEIGRSHFAQADSHLAYIDAAAMAWVYDSSFESPGWGHALRCVARRCVIEQTKVSNVQLDSTVLPPGSNPLAPNRVYIGMHPLDLYACSEVEVRDVEVTLWADAARNGLFGANLARGRQDIRNCDIGEVRDGEWTTLEPMTPEFLDPERWKKTTELVTDVDGLSVDCVGPDAAKCYALDVDTTYPILNVGEQSTFQQWLKSNLFASMDAMKLAVPPEHPEYLHIAGQVNPGNETKFLKGAIPSNVPLKVPATWYQRARVKLKNVTHDAQELIRPKVLPGFFCYGASPVACAEQVDGKNYLQAFIETR